MAESPLDTTATPAPAAPAAATPAPAPASKPQPTVSPRIAAIRDAALARAEARRKPKPVEGAPAEPVIPPDIKSAADRWRAHEKAEKARIAAAAASLSDEDRALVESEPDIARAGVLLARLTAASAPQGKQVAPPRPAGGPPPAGDALGVDFAAAVRDPKALAEAKAKDPKGYADFFSSLIRKGGSGRRSTLDVATAKS